MIDLPGYRLFSFAVGTRHTRSFSLDDSRGIIADYVLGECGAESSGVPANHYGTVLTGEGHVELRGKQTRTQFIADREKVVIAERTDHPEESLPTTERVCTVAEHLTNGVVQLLKNPKLVFVGMVWEFVRSSTKPRERFQHPAARSISRKLLKLQLKEIEHVSEASCRVSFRKKLENAYFKKGLDDYANFIINFRDVNTADLWPGVVPKEVDPQIDQPRVTLVSVDVQHIFVPRREFDTSLIKSHKDYASRFVSGRFLELLGDMSFVDQGE